MPGIKLQLWGVQISSTDPERLAQTMVKVRQEIDLTQQLMRKTYKILQVRLAEKLQNKEDFFEERDIDLVTKLGYENVLEADRSISLLDLVVVGNLVKDPLAFYKKTYKNFVALENTDDRYKKYFDAMRERNRPPFERFFRSRGLIPFCISPQKPSESCKNWDWKKRKEEDEDVSLLAQGRKKVMLVFAEQYAIFRKFPKDFKPEKLQQSADVVNTDLSEFSYYFQKDIEDFFVAPTLDNIRDIVKDEKNVKFAQVGRSTVSSLSGVETLINSKSVSTFQLPQSPNLQELLARAEALEQEVAKFIPTETLPGASGSTEIASAGPLPISRLIGLAVALSEQTSKPIEAKAGTNLTFTPGILRNLNSAELNIKLEVTAPEFKGTAEEDTIQISRVGKQEVETTVYTQALDFFDLSTFTNQATLDGGRFRIPVIGNIWNAIFDSIPGFGDLFSFSQPNQTVLHESLLLTNSFITPTPLGLGLLYNPKDSMVELNQCILDEKE